MGYVQVSDDRTREEVLDIDDRVLFSATIPKTKTIRGKQIGRSDRGSKGVWQETKPTIRARKCRLERFCHSLELQSTSSGSIHHYDQVSDQTRI